MLLRAETRPPVALIFFLTIEPSRWSRLGLRASTLMLVLTEWKILNSRCPSVNAGSGGGEEPLVQKRNLFLGLLVKITLSQHYLIRDKFMYGPSLELFPRSDCMCIFCSGQLSTVNIVLRRKGVGFSL